VSDGQGSTCNSQATSGLGRGRHGRRPDFEPRWPAEIPAAARELERRGVPRWRISDFFCVSDNTIYNWLGPRTARRKA